MYNRWSQTVVHVIMYKMFVSIFLVPNRSTRRKLVSTAKNHIGMSSWEGDTQEAPVNHSGNNIV